mgnify:CR=1 FL=1
MPAHSFLPPPSIAAYVSSILVFDHPGFNKEFTLPLYANGTPTLVFHSTRAVRQQSSVSHLSLYGQWIKPDELRLEPGFQFIAYFLHPVFPRSLFGIKASELTNECIELNQIKQAKAIRLEEQLLNASSLNERLDLINNFILRLIQGKKKENPKVAYATRQLQKANDPKALKKIQNELNTTERSLQRLFESYVGVSPKMFKRICQFHAAFQQINRLQFSSFTELAYSHDFADQSHFIRVFKEFTGLTPKEYVKRMLPEND